MAIGTPVDIGFVMPAAPSTSATQNLTTTHDVAAGDSVIVTISSTVQSRVLSSVTDSAGNTYSIDVVKQHSTSGLNVYMASCHGASALATGGTITATFATSVSSLIGMEAITVSGLAHTSTLDKSAAQEQGLGVGWSSTATAATTQADELVVGASYLGATATSTPAAGLTEIEDHTSGGARSLTMVYAVVSATGTQTASGTWSASQAKVSVVATYKADLVQHVTGAGAIATGEAVGSPTVTPGAVTLHPTGLASAQALGTPTILLAHVVSPSGIATGEAVGSPTVTPGAVTLHPTGLASAEALGAPTVTSIVVIAPPGIASGEASGAPSVSPGAVTVTPAAIESLEAFGGPTVTIDTHIILLASPVQVGSELRFQITTLRYPDTDPIVIAELQQFTNGQVGIPLNDGRDGQVTISVYDDAYRKITAHYSGGPLDEYAAMLRAFYDGNCVLWAPITGAPFRGQDATVTFVASDKVRLEDHEVVIGDEAIDPANGFGGRIPVDYRGVRMLRDAAINLPGQTARGVPDIGIANGFNDQLDNDVFITIERGTDVWSALQDLIGHGPTPGHDGSPDVEFAPTIDTPGAYVLLNTYAHQGTDKTGIVVLHFGFGRDNLAGFDSDPLGKIITHQHALGRNNKIRETRADLASSAYRGLYVKWEAKDYTGSDADLRVALGAWAQQQVEAYSIPRHVAKVTLKAEEEVADPLGQYRYLRDFIVGDEIHAEGRRGYHREVAEGRIVKVTLNQADQSKKALADLDLVPNVGGDGSATEDD